MNATKLSFEAESFDMVVDKGTIDALVCKSEENTDSIRAIIKEAWRVLKSECMLLVITYGNPQGRIPFFTNLVEGVEQTPWDITIRRVPFSPSALLTRRLRVRLKGQPLRTVTKEVLSEEMAKVQEDLYRFDTMEDRGPEKNTFCFAYCCKKKSNGMAIKVMDKTKPAAPAEKFS